MNFARPNVERMIGYIPGEQPQDAGWIKLNTNENPYPPSPRVAESVKRIAEGRLNVYPDPLVRRFSQLAGELFGVDPDWVLPGNGSDENLTILVRTFVEPGELIAAPYPSYLLYETLAEIQGARYARLPLHADWSWNTNAYSQTISQAKLLFVPNPNSPSGTHWSNEEMKALVPEQGLLVVDGAYADFCDSADQVKLLSGDLSRQVLLTRTLSKSYSLAGIRFGFSVAHPNLTAQMRKVKDSYNCNLLSIAAAEAALADQAWMRENVQKIQATRERLSSGLREFGLSVEPSQANFVWATHADHEHRELYEQLKRRKILVRYMQFPGSDADEQPALDGLRISIGTDEEITTFLQVMKELL